MQHEAQPVAAIADVVGLSACAETTCGSLPFSRNLLGSEARQAGGVFPVDHGHALEAGYVAGGEALAAESPRASTRSSTPMFQGLQQPVHRFQAEAATGVEEVGKMALLKTGLAGQTASGQLPSVDPGPDVCTQFVLQVLKSHVD